ncbi:MAG: nuclear transport factor 2 family protein [Acidimicrobiia bacterium]|nr:nuclear transport factor 2 family protein [Acidimicrobiia bacterium]
MDAVEFVDRFLTDGHDRSGSAGRIDAASSGLDAQGVLAALADERLDRRNAIEMMADLMHPDDSMYYDAIYGAFHGQADIRGWLVPTMQEIDFIDFVPQMPTAVFEDGAGGTSLDEWQMVARLDGVEIPLSKGVSVRRYRDGWITWNADVYDTGPFRNPPDPESEAADLPPWPRTPWEATPRSGDIPLSPAVAAWLGARSTSATNDIMHEPSGLTHRELFDVVHHPEIGCDWNVVADLMHPTECIYTDPIFGEFRGQSAIRSWLDDVMPKVGSVRFDAIGPVLFNGDASVQEFMQLAVQPDGSTVPIVRGTSVRRYADGWIVYAADYFDTAPLADPEIRAASLAAGSALTVDDIVRYRG